MLVLYGSPEYLNRVPKGSGPLFREMNDSTADAIAEKAVHSMLNHEIHSPPLYYFIAGKWLTIGTYLISNDGLLLYWLRFMNVIFYGLLLWLAYIFCQTFFPEEDAIRIGVPMLLAVFPNDIFYSMNSDGFSALFCLLALYLLFRIYTSAQSILFFTLTGFASAATVLVKLTNFPMLVLSIGVVSILLHQRIKDKQLKHYRWHFVALIIAVVAPLLLWMGWNAYALGDLLGTSGKIEILGWTRKPISQWFNHPLFTVEGLGPVASNFNLLIDTFWRGELVWWQGEHTAPDAADWFFTITSILFITAGIMRLLSARGNTLASKSTFRFIFVLLLTMYLGFLMISSIQFDFGNCATPSRENPFFNKGRLIIGGLIPFLILYVDGLVYVLSMIKHKINPLLFIGTICLIILTFSTLSTYKFFSSEWNWFHLFL